jgi:glycosyltransferase involved in cell wall biosynthesis
MPDLWNELPEVPAPQGTRLLPIPSISVVIPTRDRPEALRRCLDALAVQTIADELEAIVVDDGSLAGDLVAEMAREYPFVRLIRQPAGGPARARNVGIANARASVVCLTDDDCEPSAVWAEHLAAAIRAGADAVAGWTTTGELANALAVASDIIVGAPASSAGPSPEDLSFAPTNNIACRRDVLLAVPFDDRYPAAAGEDRDWCARLVAAGYVLRSQPTAALIHRPGLTLQSFLRQQVRYGRGAFWFHRDDRFRRPLEAPAFYIALMRRGFRHGLRAGLLVTAAQGATAAGFLLARAAARRR